MLHQLKIILKKLKIKENNILKKVNKSKTLLWKNWKKTTIK